MEKLKDNDGNIYNIIQIGNFKIIAENYRCTTFRTDVPYYVPVFMNEMRDALIWTDNNNSEPAYFSNYTNKYDYKNKYGLIYNQKAISTNGFCPQNWRVPTEDDFNYIVTQVTQSTGMLKLKESGTSHWSTNNGLNSYCFNGLPAGFRDSTGIFTEYNITKYWIDGAFKSFDITDDLNNLVANNRNTNDGCSVRLIQGYIP